MIYRLQPYALYMHLFFIAGFSILKIAQQPLYKSEPDKIISHTLAFK